MMMPSQTSPDASVSELAAPNGSSNATRTASRIPMPPCVSGSSAASFANGHAKSHTRSGKVSQQEIASSAFNKINVP